MGTIAINKSQCLGISKNGLICGRFIKGSYCFQHKEQNITFIDLFSGIGAFHYGLKQLVPEARCLLASDINKDCNSGYFLNFGIKPKLNILDLDVKDIANPDILFAGFPCQTFSVIGKKAGFDKPIFSIFEKVLSILKLKNIGSFIFENVRNLITMNGGVV